MPKTSLIITPFPPLNPRKSVTGIFRRLRMFASSLSKVSTRVRLLGMVPEAEVAAAGDGRALAEALREEWGFPVEIRLCASRSRAKTAWNQYGPGLLDIGEQPGFYHYGGPAQVQAVREELEKDPDILFVHRLSAMIPVFKSVSKSGLRPRNIFFDLDDVEHTVRLREMALRAPSPGKLLSLGHIPAIVAAERRSIAWAERTFVCSEPDRRHLGRFAPAGKISVIHNAVDMPPPAPDRVEEPTILFLGDLKHGPNREGAERLLNRIWPLIRARRADARLIVAGPGPESLPSFARAPAGVEFTGFVEDLPALYRRAQLIICPLVTGGGTRIKLIEAASRCKPMVSTAIGAENLGLEDGREILLRDGDEDIALACDRLLGDAALCERLGMAAYEKVAGIYAREVVERLILQSLTSRAAPPAEGLTARSAPG